MVVAPLVSVIIPCYNVSAYIKKAVTSIINQTYTNLEIILVDDASTDNTLEIINSIDDPRIKRIAFKENTRKIGAVNAALNLATGAFIAFQDADDWSELNKIEKQVSQFGEAIDLGVCFTKYRIINQKISVPEKIAKTDNELKDEFLKFGNRELTHLAPTMCATMMISRAVLNDTKGYHSYFSGRVAEDSHWVYRILKIYKGIAVNEPLYNINIREGSLTNIQFSGRNAKASYSWCLLSKIIAKDINENVDLLSVENEYELLETELKACEEVLIESIIMINKTRVAYESSRSYQLGNFLLTPIRLYNKIRGSFN